MKIKLPDWVVRPLRLLIVLCILYKFVTVTSSYIIDKIVNYSSSDYETDIIYVTTSNQNEPLIVNINTATSSELQQLKGIGLTKARAIIAYREKHGEFKSVEELAEVEGISEKMVEELREFVTVDAVLPVETEDCENTLEQPITSTG